MEEQNEEQVDKEIDNKVDELKNARNAWKKKELNVAANAERPVIPNVGGTNRAARRKAYK